ncbi:MAG TPA: DUF1905 domain-containing protein [Candidatus Fermentibacter sp.]|nr:DUF1905 domain-containing protein [Candidatus Fermentibacter sp.]
MAREFTAAIEDAGGGGAFVRVPFDAEAEYGSRRPEITATIDGVPYTGRLIRMGLPCHLLPVVKDIRKKLGKGPGDEVRVVIDRIGARQTQDRQGMAGEG